MSNINLKQYDDKDKKIIEQKGNTKCIFYSDDICRKGDRTRDCINCARVEYHSLYSLNWDNQDKLWTIINNLMRTLKQIKEYLNQYEMLGKLNIKYLEEKIEKTLKREITK